MPPLLRIPYTDPLPLPKIIPSSAVTVEGAVAALVDFLSAGHAGVRARRPRASDVESERHVREQHRQEESWRRSAGGQSHRAATGIGSGSGSGEGTAGARGADVRAWGKTLLLTGAGISVASGLADYRGTNGTYTLNKTYKPIYYNEFCASHEARKRYWARSFLGWTTLHQAKANDAHRACGRLAELGIVDNLITQNVDSFHPLTHPHLPTIELHGYLRSLVCLTCHSLYPRSTFQSQLSMLNPAWAAFLTTLLTTGALNTEDPHSRRKLGLKANPDGDIDVPNAPYTTFRYPACPVCLAKTSSTAPTVSTDADGAWTPPSTTGILKPAVTMFGENISPSIKLAAEAAVDSADRLLVIGSSLATYSAWRLAKRARERGLPIGIVNLGGVRGEGELFGEEGGNGGRDGVRVSVGVERVLPEVVRVLEGW